jgi:uncharacterized protein (DUF697 family)
MGIVRSAWERIYRQVAPKVDSGEIEAILRKVRHTLPTPVFWLLGKTGQGKTSIVRALTLRDDAEIGKGFRPCTTTAAVYPFPAEEGCILKFLDTRGLGDPSYEPAEDLKLFAEQSHCVIVVIKAMDHAQQETVCTLRAIHARRPQWPVIVCQTALHEGYPAGAAHARPYLYGSEPFPPAVPHDLARSLLAQRQWFQRIPAQFVPLDFTYSEHGQQVYDPWDYGLDALWAAIDAAVPLGLREMVRTTNAIRRRLHDAYFDAAHPHILVYAAAAGGAGAIPLPYVDLPLVLAIQAKLFHTVASIYGQTADLPQMAGLAAALGSRFLLRFAIRELSKAIPGLGSAVSGTFAAASTYGLGLALCEYFSRVRDGDVPDPKQFRQWYHEGFAAARQRFMRSHDEVTVARP